MFDIHPKPVAGRDFHVIRNPEFFRIEIAPMADGRIFISLTATTVDDEEPELLDQEIACDRVATIDDVLALIKAHVRVTPPSPLPSD